MIQLIGLARCRWVWVGVCLASLGTAGPAFAQEFRTTQPRSSGRIPASIPTLSEATAILESEVRNLYTLIEPGRETMPNELIAYADLRALRLYTGALEVAGWDLEQAAANWNDMNNGRYRSGRRGRPSTEEIEVAHERYLAFRETVRTLLYRVRTTSVAVEHQVSFCDRQISRAWDQKVVPALMDAIAATQPMFYEQDTYSAYRVPGTTTSNVITTTAGIPSNAVEITRVTVHQPYEGQGRGTGRYFEIRAYGGPVRVKSIRYRSHESAFGSIATTVQRELAVDQIASPSQPLYIPCNRERFVDLSQLEVEWENADSRRKTFATIDVIADLPADRN